MSQGRPRRPDPDRAAVGSTPCQTPAPREPVSEGRELRFAAALLSGSIVASRLLGFVREMVLAALLGAGRETDAYLAAFVVPDVINHFLAGGALSAALLPIFAQRLVGGRPDDAWKLVVTVIRIAVAVLVVALIGAGIAAEPILRAWYPGFDDAQIELTVHLTRIILPGPVFFTIGALLNATEQANKRFWATALMPLVYNLCIIVGGLAGHRALGVAGFSWGVLVGSVAGPFLIPLIASWKQARLRERLPLNDSDVRRFFYNAAPVLASSSLIFFDEWLGRRFASELDEGAITWLNNARRLMLLPAALVGQAISQAAFPFLARLVHAGDRDAVAGTLLGVIRATVALSAVAAAGLFVTATSGVDLVYHRGAYTADDAAMTAALLAALAFAVPGWSVYTVALRALHATERMWLSSGIGLATLVPSWFVYATLAERSGVLGLAQATGGCISGAALVMLAAVHRAYAASPWLALSRGLAEGAGIGALAAWVCLAGLPATGLTEPSDPAWLRFTIEAGTFTAASLVALAFVPGPTGDAVRRRLRTRR